MTALIWLIITISFAILLLVALGMNVRDWQRYRRPGGRKWLGAALLGTLANTLGLVFFAMLVTFTASIFKEGIA